MNNKRKMKTKKDWGHGTSSRAPAKEAQGPKFKPQCCKNKQIRKKNHNTGQVPWLTPIILATQEAEIRMIMDPSQPSQIVLETLSQTYPTRKGMGSGSRGRIPA
jgi:hypothetical protein